jgi:redox-sensing transcriptional repressor
MRKSQSIPTPVIRRLSLYLRQLDALLDAEKKTVSSRQLGEALGLSDAQVRKDLACFGQFGHRGVGYNIEELISRIRRILGTDRRWNIVLVGAGNLGRALVSYRGFAKKGFHPVAIFDNDKRVIGKTIKGETPLVVQPMSTLSRIVKKHDVRLAVMAVPAASAIEVASRIRSAGVRGILNFAPTTINPPRCAVAAVDLTVHLEQLAFQIAGRAIT